ncbi:MAG: peptidoglycan DD-metalloendopeptidase family protein [Draconibacterium sp.]
MLRTIIISIITFFLLINPAVAQYVNTDSLLFDANHIPAMASQLDSFEIYSPEILPQYFTNGVITVGYLLSRFELPTTGKVISRFGPRSGRMHTGTDIKKLKGDTIYAAYDGQVTMSRYYHGYGNLVVLDHGNSLETYYAHLSKFLVKPGEPVRIGMPIGLAGATGRATTTHLHFEIREEGKPYDPEMVFDFENGCVQDHVIKSENLAALHKELKPARKTQTSSSTFQSIVSQNYIVRAGDSLYKIAKRSKTTITALCRLNNLTEASILQIGQVIKVY